MDRDKTEHCGNACSNHTHLYYLFLRISSPEYHYCHHQSTSLSHWLEALKGTTMNRTHYIIIILGFDISAACKYSVIFITAV